MVLIFYWPELSCLGRLAIFGLVAVRTPTSTLVSLLTVEGGRNQSILPNFVRPEVSVATCWRFASTRRLRSPYRLSRMSFFHSMTVVGIAKFAKSCCPLPLSDSSTLPSDGSAGFTDAWSTHAPHVLNLACTVRMDLPLQTAVLRPLLLPLNSSRPTLPLSFGTFQAFCPTLSLDLIDQRVVRR